MSARLAGIAVASTLAALGAAALAGPAPPRNPARVDVAATPTATAIATAAPAAAVTDIAEAYALAARTWSAATRLASWRRELALTTGAYHRALLAARPTRAQLDALRRDRADSSATVLASNAALRGDRARVLLDLRERTRADGAVITGVTRNELQLRRRAGGWRVVGFTVIPGAGTG